MPVNPVAAKPNYISLGGLGILAVLFLAVGVWPCWHDYDVLTLDIAAKRRQLADLQDQSQQLKDGNAQIQLISMQVKNYDRLVPESQALGEFLEQLSRELTAAGIKDASTRALPPATLGKCQQLPIEIHGSGTAFACFDFIQRLERLPRMSSVSRIAVETDTAITGQVTIDLTVSIYSSIKAQ